MNSGKITRDRHNVPVIASLSKMNQLLILPTADCSPFNSIKSGRLPVTLGWLVNDWPNNYVQNYSRNGAYWLPIGLLDPVAVQSTSAQRVRLYRFSVNLRDLTFTVL
ncbi:hypothetical protein TNIN_171091 [Trichonephila inaurata madagascariensis]|uniref:Uncharacterized protein n=1 Tax=Trichonephila inaurata madagascariensis TaxID=2747483 RepID=A0A8X7C9B5_9ARAC|nr:hypothetical protein TNIN_171091 [Trichonephila inaurata madagascariensis]